MTFEIETPSRTRMVRVATAGRGYDVTVDSRRRPVDAVPVGGGTWSVVIGGRSHDVGVVERTLGDLTVYVNGSVVPVRVGGQQWRRRRAATTRGRTSDIATLGFDPAKPERIASPMPGRVVKLLVKPGDMVSARQGVVVVEAMKMENEIRASRAGVVQDVRVAEGASVEANTVLMVIEQRNG